MRIKSLVTAAALGASALALGGCATGFPAQVSRYQAMPAPQGQSFFVLPTNPAQSGSLEFNHYGAMVAQALQAQGYAPATSPQTATMLVHFGYGVDQGRREITAEPGMYDPFMGPWESYRRYGVGQPYYSRWGYYGARAPFYYGWGDPFYSPYGYSPYGMGGYSQRTVYESFVDLDIRRKGDNAGLFDGHARARSGSDNLNMLVPNLVTALFTGFPGKSGETVKITVPAEQRAK